MNSIRQNKTWDLVKLLKSRCALPCKWVYTLKETFDSTAPKFKHRLVAKGFRQEYGVDFDEFFSLVVKITTLHFMLGIVATENLELIQLDVKTTFLHGDLGNIYGAAERLRGIGPGTSSLPTQEESIGLKQALQQWYQKFDAFIQSVGFSKSDEDHCIFTNTTQDGSPIFLIIYVDYMLLSG